MAKPAAPAPTEHFRNRAIREVTRNPNLTSRGDQLAALAIGRRLVESGTSERNVFDLLRTRPLSSIKEAAQAPAPPYSVHPPPLADSIAVDAGSRLPREAAARATAAVMRDAETLSQPARSERETRVSGDPAARAEKVGPRPSTLHGAETSATAGSAPEAPQPPAEARTNVAARSETPASRAGASAVEEHGTAIREARRERLASLLAAHSQRARTATPPAPVAAEASAAESSPVSPSDGTFHDELSRAVRLNPYLRESHRDRALALVKSMVHAGTSGEEALRLARSKRFIVLEALESAAQRKRSPAAAPPAPAPTSSLQDRLMQAAARNANLASRQREIAVRHGESLVHLGMSRDEALELVETANLNVIVGRDSGMRSFAAAAAEAKAAGSSGNGDSHNYGDSHDVSFKAAPRQPGERRMSEFADPSIEAKLAGFMQSLFAAAIKFLPQYATQAERTDAKSMVVSAMVLYAREYDSEIAVESQEKAIKELVRAWGVRDLTLKLNALNAFQRKRGARAETVAAKEAAESSDDEQSTPAERDKRLLTTRAGDRDLLSALGMSSSDPEKLDRASLALLRERLDMLVQVSPDPGRAAKHVEDLKHRFGGDRVRNLEEAAARMKAPEAGVHAARRGVSTLEASKRIDTASFVLLDLAEKLDFKTSLYFEDAALPAFDAGVCVKIIKKAGQARNFSLLALLPLALSDDETAKGRELLRNALAKLEKSGLLEELRRRKPGAHAALQPLLASSARHVLPSEKKALDELLSLALGEDVAVKKQNVSRARLDGEAEGEREDERSDERQGGEDEAPAGAAPALRVRDLFPETASRRTFTQLMFSGTARQVFDALRAVNAETTREEAAALLEEEAKRITIAKFEGGRHYCWNSGKGRPSKLWRVSASSSENPLDVLLAKARAIREMEDEPEDASTGNGRKTARVARTRLSGRRSAENEEEPDDELIVSTGGESGSRAAAVQAFRAPRGGGRASGAGINASALTASSGTAPPAVQARRLSEVLTTSSDFEEAEHVLFAGIPREIVAFAREKFGEQTTLQEIAEILREEAGHVNLRKVKGGAFYWFWYPGKKHSVRVGKSDGDYDAGDALRSKAAAIEKMREEESRPARAASAGSARATGAARRGGARFADSAVRAASGERASSAGAPLPEAESIIRPLVFPENVFKLSAASIIDAVHRQGHNLFPRAIAARLREEVARISVEQVDGKTCFCWNRAGGRIVLGEVTKVQPHAKLIEKAAEIDALASAEEVGKLAGVLADGIEAKAGRIKPKR